MKFPGYLTATEALADGFTHHGKYFGVPLWVGNVDDEGGGLLVATKWAPLEYVMTAMHHIEGTLRPLLFPDDPPVFQFLIGAPIDPSA